MILSNKICNTKDKKKKIENDKKYEMIMKIKAKNEKYENRKKIKEFARLALYMNIFLVMMTSSLILDKKVAFEIQKRKYLNKNLKIFYVFSMILSKLTGILKKIREKKATRVINKTISKMRLWIVRRKNSYRQLIITLIDDYLKKSLLQVAFIKFTTIIISIQRY